MGLGDEVLIDLAIRKNPRLLLVSTVDLVATVGDECPGCDECKKEIIKTLAENLEVDIMQRAQKVLAQAISEKIDHNTSEKEEEK